MWEFQVQELINQTKPPKRRDDPRSVRLGFDEAGLGAVMVLDELEPGALYELTYGAVALRLRGAGGLHADEMMRDALDLITSRCIELGSSEVLITGYIDPGNLGSKRMCTRHGLSYRSMDEKLEVWSRTIDLDEPLDLEQ